MTPDAEPGGPSPTLPEPSQRAPDAAGWTLAAGVSISLHIGLTTALVLGLSGSPGAAPGLETQITLRSVPLIAGGTVDEADRLAASPADARLQAEAERARAAPSLRPEALAALAPDQGLTAADMAPEDPVAGRARPQTVVPLAPARLQAEAGRTRADPAHRPEALAALAPENPVSRSARPETTAALAAPDRLETLRAETTRATAAPQPQSAERTQLRVQPLAQSVPVQAAEQVTEPGAEPAPARTTAQSPAQALAPQSPLRAAPAPRLAALPSRPDPATPSADSGPTRLRPEGSSAPAAPAQAESTSAPVRAEPPARTPPAALRMAMQPPTEDTLERALRDRPRTFLSDRRAGPRPDSGAAAGAGADAPDQALHGAVLSHLRALPDIPCFAALPALNADGRLHLEVFGPARGGLESFRAGLEAETGPVPGLVAQTVTQGQCDTLDFIRRNRAYPDHDLILTLTARRIATGGQLEGAIQARAEGRAIALLLVDNAGRVQSLERFLSHRPGGAGFAIPLTRQGPAVETWQLLLAVATDSPLQSLATLNRPQEAATVFARLRAEFATRGLTPDLAMVAFSLN